MKRLALTAFTVLVVFTAGTTLVSAQTAAPAKPATLESAVPRDGQHDFDFMIGKWKGTLKRRLKPLTGSNNWVEFEGTQTTTKIFDGLANMDDFIVDNPTTNTHIRGVTLRFYRPDTKEWNIYWVNAKDGVLGRPVKGQFKDGRGEFYDQDEFNGRTIFIRYAWSNITKNSAHFEQSFSDDGGKTWETNWISDITRIVE